jgi:FkbM family methyltransferase
MFINSVGGKIRNLLSGIFKLFPSGSIKDRIRVLYYNLNKKNGFSIAKYNQQWVAKYSDFILRFDGKLVPYHVLRTNHIFLHHFPEEDTDILVDAGAYIGTFSLFTVYTYKSIKRIIALEPDPNNFQILKANFQLNELPGYELLKAGLWSNKTALTLFSDLRLGSSIYSEDNKGKSVTIDVDTIDNLLKGVHGKRIFIKMNIEGAELEALTACTETIKNNKVYLAVAADHMVNGELTKNKVESICVEMGLSVTTFTEDRYITVYASNEAVYKSSITI